MLGDEIWGKVYWRSTLLYSVKTCGRAIILLVQARYTDLQYIYLRLPLGAAGYRYQLALPSRNCRIQTYEVVDGLFRHCSQARRLAKVPRNQKLGLQRVEKALGSV
jgi:hypothetical protein